MGTSPTWIVRTTLALCGLLALTSPLAELSAQVGSNEFVYVRRGPDRNNQPNFEMRKRNIYNNSDTRLFSGCLANIRAYCVYGDPAVSPDGTRLAFMHDAVGEISCKSIWIANLNGGNARQISAGCNHTRPTWSPNGRWIAFQNGSSIDEIALCRNTFPERSPRRITAGRNPSYSPNSRWIAFDRNNSVYKIRRNGSSETPLALSSLLEREPRWTKPGSPVEGIIYLHGGNNRFDLYMMDEDGQNKTRKVATVSDKSSPDVALVPAAFVWEEDESIWFAAGANAPRRLGEGRDPFMGHGTTRSTQCP